MAKFVPDLSTNRWVIIAEGRSKRPTEAKAVNVNKICAFCPGFEKIPGEELFRLGEGGAYEAGWKVRVIKNKFPITDFHEVIIHSPDDKVDIPDLALSQVELIIRAYRDRYNANKANGHVIIFNNVGELAGASLNHPHSQLVVVPRQITIDSLSLEPVKNVVVDSKDFVVFCPEFSQWPFEVWIAPKQGGKLFGDISDSVISDLASVLKHSLKRIVDELSSQDHYHPGLSMVKFKAEPAYNFYIHHGENWYIRIIPRLIHRAGFELGTGLSVNIVDPADAAAILRGERK
ncbi:MAG TPA: DUF4931 domain-containing protein [Candidatus Saccharimonadales bacterium]|nr:DUF4931 domain-containing protein [Candidatus Saccharimonadales bacterium]